MAGIQSGIGTGYRGSSCSLYSGKMAAGLILAMAILLMTLVDPVSSARKPDKQNGAGGGNSGNSATAKLLNGLLRRYDNQLPPDTHNATLVHVFIHVNRIYHVDETNMAFKIDLHFKQQWFDKRLRFPSNTDSAEQMLRLDQETAEKVWRPDSFFRNMMEASDFRLPTEQRLTFLYSSGRVYSSQRMELSLYCHMAFHKFPFDQQTCPVTIETMANNMNAVVLKWSPLFANAVELSSDLGMTNYIATKVLLHDCNKENYTANSFSCIEFQLVLRRNLAIYIKDLYIPQLMLICISFLSFFVSAEAVLARMTLLIVCAVTMVAHAVVLSSRMKYPDVPYYTGADVWMTVNFAMLFLTVIEFALSASFPSRLLAPTTEQTTNSNFYMAADEHGNGSPGQLEENLMDHKRQKYVVTERGSARRRRIDFVARFVFPLVYIGFNVVYWVYYCLL